MATLKDNPEVLGLLFYSSCDVLDSVLPERSSARLVSALRSTEDAEESGAVGKFGVF